MTQTFYTGTVYKWPGMLHGAGGHLKAVFFKLRRLLYVFCVCAKNQDPTVHSVNNVLNQQGSKLTLATGQRSGKISQ